MKIKTAIFAVFLAASLPVAAEEIELGWGNLPDCTRMTCSGKGLFCPDTLERGEQRLRLLLSYNAPSSQGIQNLVNSCGQTGVKAATLPALLTGLSAAAPIFWAAFSACMSSSYSELGNLNLCTGQKLSL